jgi:3'-phosphoadenosine 5'-phosphosulfate sulfotransferase (PAPS reductase)/FAD synthetase
MPTVIKGQPASAEVCAQLAAGGRPVLVAFSCGKDSLAATLALMDAGVEVILAHMYLIPGREPGTTLDFVEESLAYMERAYGQRIHRYPHPSLWRWLNNLVFQPPERCAIIEAAHMPTYTYEQLWKAIREDLGLPADTWVADGVRAADSIQRRASLTKHGVMKHSSHKVSPVADWLKGEVMDRIKAAGVELPVDYDWFGRSFDGIDHRFLEPISRNAPDDYERILDWFPLADLELMRARMGQVA